MAVTFFIFSCSTPGGNQGKSNFVEGKGYCVHKYGDNAWNKGCSCSYEHESDNWSCLSGPTTDCEDNKSKAGQCIRYVPDLNEWIKQMEKTALEPGEPASISNDN